MKKYSVLSGFWTLSSTVIQVLALCAVFQVYLANVPDPNWVIPTLWILASLVVAILVLPVFALAPIYMHVNSKSDVIYYITAQTCFLFIRVFFIGLTNVNVRNLIMLLLYSVVITLILYAVAWVFHHRFLTHRALSDKDFTIQERLYLMKHLARNLNTLFILPAHDVSCWLDSFIEFCETGAEFSPKTESQLQELHRQLRVLYKSMPAYQTSQSRKPISDATEEVAAELKKLYGLEILSYTKQCEMVVSKALASK